MSDRIQSFAPFVDNESQILILGSVPGAKSLAMKEYYAHPQNAFWKIIFHLFNQKFTTDYHKKIELLKTHHIALWDVIESCERKGSIDSTIKNESENDIRQLLKSYPNIKVIFCNGQKSYKNLIKLLGKDFSLPIVLLPSTSPLHTISFDKKLVDWQQIVTNLEFS